MWVVSHGPKESVVLDRENVLLYFLPNVKINLLSLGVFDYLSHKKN